MRRQLLYPEAGCPRRNWACLTRETLAANCGVKVVANAVATPTPYSRLGITLRIFVGAVREFAAPKAIISEAKSEASAKAVDRRWVVTSPPILMPTRKSGS